MISKMLCTNRFSPKVPVGKACVSEHPAQAHEVYPRPKVDRRLAPNIPGRGQSRRGGNRRFEAGLQVSVLDLAEEAAPLRCLSEDLSSSGVLLHWLEHAAKPEIGDTFILRFTMPPGTLPEGYEARVKIKATVVRVNTSPEGLVRVAFNFSRDLDDYLRVSRWRRLLLISLLFLAFSVLAIIYMREESFFYFMFDVPIFMYGIAASVFLISRFTFAFFTATFLLIRTIRPELASLFPASMKKSGLKRPYNVPLIRNILQKNWKSSWWTMAAPTVQWRGFSTLKK